MLHALGKTIHPFPARMAADVALAGLAALPAGATMLDPMAGSGTTLRAAAQQGVRAFGFDTDPLAVLMAQVWAAPIDPDDLRRAALEAVMVARSLDDEGATLPWMDTDEETTRFIAYWFAAPQQRDLRRLAWVLFPMRGVLGDALRVALSRIIVTKSRIIVTKSGGASLSRDASHSRPHRVRDTNDYAVFDGFVRSASEIAARLAVQPLAPATVRRGDARALSAIATGSIDAVVTSPPYLNAIDYLRGHRLALVWLGHTIPELRSIRAANIGSERVTARAKTAGNVCGLSDPAIEGEAGPRLRAMVERYALDLTAVLAEAHRVLRPGGSATFVVGNSCVQGAFVRNDVLIIAAAERAGFALRSTAERELPPNRRYLPPPTHTDSPLQKRMRTECVLMFTA